VVLNRGVPGVVVTTAVGRLDLAGGGYPPGAVLTFLQALTTPFTSTPTTGGVDAVVRRTRERVGRSWRKSDGGKEEGLLLYIVHHRHGS